MLKKFAAVAVSTLTAGTLLAATPAASAEAPNAGTEASYCHAKTKGNGWVRSYQKTDLGPLGHTMKSRGEQKSDCLPHWSAYNHGKYNRHENEEANTVEWTKQGPVWAPVGGTVK